MLEPVVKELAQGANLAFLATILPDGQPQLQPVWVDADDEHLIINTEAGRQKHRNIDRDPRVTLTIVDPQDPYRYVEVRGKVVEVIDGPEARQHMDQLSRKYTGRDYTSPIRTHRLKMRIAPQRQRVVGF